MTNVTEHIVRGGQTQLHTFRMLAQVIVTTLVLSCVGGALYFAWYAYSHLSWMHFKITGAYCLAHVLGEAGLSQAPFPGKDGLQYEPISWILTNPVISTIATKTIAILKEEALATALVIVLLFIAINGFWIYKGRKVKTKQVISGGSVATTKELKTLLQGKAVSPITIAGVPLVQGSETQHLMFAGTTGTGKSNAINELLIQIRELGHKAVIVDTTSLIVPKFLRKQDYVLGMDARAQPWHLWAECKDDADREALAESMIPQTGHDPFWSNAARTIFVESIKKLSADKDFSTKRLLDLMMRQSTTALYKALQNTPASSMVDPASERLTLSIRSTLATHIKCLESVDDTDKPFSIRQWMSKADEGGWVFLSCLPGQRAQQRPLLSGWLSIAMRAAMDLPPSLTRRIWFIIDELPSLNVIGDLPRALSELRKYGGCCVLGIQDLSQADELYGQNVTRSIAGLTGTKVIFRAADEYNAERFSRFLGQQEVMESLTSITFGAHQVRDGVSLAEHRQLRPVVSANDIMALNNLEAYLSLPGTIPVAKVGFTYHELPDIAVGFVAKEKAETLPTANTD